MNTPDTNLGVGAAEDIWTSPLSADTKRMPQAVANPPMIATQLETAGGRSGNVNAAALGAADWLCLAAAPTFAIMALLTGVLGGGPPDMLCSAAQDALPLSGMIPMYLLMSAFHFGALAEADLQPTKRCPPVLIRRSPDRALPNLPRP